VSIGANIAAALWLLLPAQAGGGDRAAEILRRLDTHSAEALDRAAHALAALGPTAMDELFALVSPEAAGARDELLARSFALQPRPELQAFFGGFTCAALAAERYKPALLVLREAGSARELVRCLELAGPCEGPLEPDLVAALAAICARDPAAPDLALGSACNAGLCQAETIARALAEARTGLTARALAHLAQRRPELAVLAFSSLLAEAERLPRPLEPELLAELREQLGHEDHPAAQELLLLAGRLEDDEAVPLLIERLDSTHPALCANALWSLRRITGLGLGADAPAWSQWFHEELQWWRERAPEALPLLQGNDAAAQRRVLGELGARYWHRERVAAELCEYLERARGDGARMACGLLARLGCASATAALQARLEDSDADVRESARAALASLTGKKIPSRSVGLPALSRATAAR